MIPADYRCAECHAVGVKLWRQAHAFAEEIHLQCASCAERATGSVVDLSRRDQIEGGRTGADLVPAVPDLRGHWWGYTSVPPEGVAWWSTLPLAWDGAWRVRGGVERWVPYIDWQAHMSAWELRRVDLERGRALVFIAGPMRMG